MARARRAQASTQRVCVGVDGCAGGWVAVAESPEGVLAAQCCPGFLELVRAFAKSAVLAVDIPIGLLQMDTRVCDIQARSELGRPRGSSVFPAPLRAVLVAHTWEEACEVRFRIEGKRMSRQAWGIVEKVREVDQVLRRDPRLARRVVEIHPEVSFAVWAGEPMAHSKKKAAGRTARLKLIEAEWPGAVSECRERLRGEAYQTDDLYDAFAALWTAKRIAAGKSRAIPAAFERDPAGLPMRIEI
jgi:predicted RNase H-like nuclease